MEIDRLFVETLDDLEARAVWGPSEYALLRAAALLRELVIDEKPLMLTANRGRHHRIAFEVRLPPPDQPILAWVGIDPTEPAEGGEIQEMRIKEFLAFPMFFLGQSTLTVKDLFFWAPMSSAAFILARRGLRLIKPMRLTR